MSRKLFYLFLSVIVSLNAFGQSVLSLTGSVTDTRSQPLENVSVHILNTNFGAITNERGEFSIPGISKGVYTVVYSAIGFATTDNKITLDQNKYLVIKMDDASSRLDAVLVTAQKKEESLQQVPFSISALSARQVQQYRVWNSREISGIVPNLFSSNPGDNRNITSVRGITSTSYDPAVATYIDGVNQFNLDTYISDLIDIERIEVLRGPQGTLYGRNAMGGVINIITKQPTNKTNGFAEASIGNYGRQRYSAGLRAPLVKDKLYFGVSGMYNGRDGYYTNEFNNTSFDKQHSVTGNYYLRYLANNRWSLSFNLKHHNNRNHGPFALINGIEEAFSNPFKLNQDATTRMVDNVFNTSLSINHSGNEIDFTSQTAYQSNRRYYENPIDGDFSPIDGVTIINNYGNEWNKVKVLTQEFRFSSATGKSSPIKWTAGTYFFVQDNPVKQATRFGEDAALVGAPDKLFSIINTSKGKGYGAAAFGQIEYEFLNTLKFIAGLRYDYERKEQSILGEYQKDPDPNPQFAIQPDTSARASFTAFSPKAGFIYYASANTNIYATYTRGYRAGGLTPLGSDPSQPPLYAYKPEYSSNVELGIKNTFFNNRLRANIALFYVQVSDAQVPTLILPDAITITRNAGEMNSKGFEVELSSTPVKGLQFDYNFGYTDAVYKEGKLSLYGAEIDLEGKRQVFTPDITSMLAVQYSINLGTKHLLKLVTRGEWFYFGRQYFDLANNISQGPYNLLNTRLGVSSKCIDVMFWGRNLGNRRYIDFAYDFGAVHLADPKTYGVTVYARFN